MSEHTPGPWRWVIHDHSCASLGVGDDPGLGTPLVMSVSPCRSCADRAKDGEWEWGRCTTPSEANARLIAAAPDLLEALKLYMASVELMNAAMKDGGNVHGALSALVGAEDMANWAIAKAEGRS